MEYILVVEFESLSEVTSKIMNLPLTHLIQLETYFQNLNVLCKRIQDEMFEVDVEGVKILTVLGGPAFCYRVISQSMAIEETVIGGGTVKIQKTIWTMGKEK
ncbi:PREDICTED: uncharacterized protein LOC106104598 [Papilio polytes]|uniref:uncharacterized protein LOC106104598 n=1 Tax=Papilio polytes TaxID=76194 RepID=UPI0006763814|nr:PREDICTED: uncharacterized protein LOC106104598 [Papilio polytes]